MTYCMHWDFKGVNFNINLIIYVINGRQILAGDSFTTQPS